MKARIPPSAADRRTISEAAVQHNKQYRELITNRLFLAVRLAANDTLGVGRIRGDRLIETLGRILTEYNDFYDDLYETGMERECRRRGLIPPRTP